MRKSWTSRISDIGDSSSLFEDLSEGNLTFGSDDKGGFIVGVRHIREKENCQQQFVHSKKTNPRIRTTKDKMVREVSPAKTQKLPRSSQEEPLRSLDNANVSKPRGPPGASVFGQPSKMESPLGRAAKDVFIQPKQQRPEHHRPMAHSSRSFRFKLSI